jgi:hypothetical protein
MSNQTTNDMTEAQDAAGSGLGGMALFDLDSFLLDSPRMAEIKAHDIQTHHCQYDEEPWLAIPMNAARKIVGALPDDPACTTLPEIMANYCCLLEENEILFYGMTEREAQDAALAYLSNVPHHLPRTDGATDAREAESASGVTAGRG